MFKNIFIVSFVRTSVGKRRSVWVGGNRRVDDRPHPARPRHPLARAARLLPQLLPGNTQEVIQRLDEFTSLLPSFSMGIKRTRTRSLSHLYTYSNRSDSFHEYMESEDVRRCVIVLKLNTRGTIVCI